jgi:hypothetical protein
MPFFVHIDALQAFDKGWLISTAPKDTGFAILAQPIRRRSQRDFSALFLREFLTHREISRPIETRMNPFFWHFKT